MQKIIGKVVAPTRLDFEPMGTIWEHVLDQPLKYNIYIQISDNTESPEWISFGDLLTETFREKVGDEKFMKDQIKKYRDLRTQAEHSDLHYRLVSEGLEAKKKNKV